MKELLITKEIACVKDLVTVFDEDFSDPKHQWEITLDKDEHSWMHDGYYHMENRSEDTWMYYTMDSGMDMDEEDFIIDAQLRSEKLDEYYAFGLVFGFKKNPKDLNRFAFNPVSRKCVMAAFDRLSSRPWERFHAYAEDKLQEDNLYRFVILKLCGRIYFFLNDMEKPVLETDAARFHWNGNRFGFYVEPFLKVEAKSIKVKKIVREEIGESNFSRLIEW